MSSPTAPTATNRLGVRDLATIGIFTALLFVLSIVTGTVTSLHPMVYLFNPALLALLGAVFYAIIGTRVQKRGAAFLTATIVGVAWGVLGGWPLTVLMLIAGVFGEVVLARGGAAKLSRITGAWIAFTLANYGGVFGAAMFAADSFRASGEGIGQDPGYINDVISAAQSQLALVALGVMVALAVVVMLFARRMLRKHFSPGQA